MKKMLMLIGLSLIISLTLFCTNSLIYGADVPVPKATNFSFASDTFHQGPTCTGVGNTISSDAQVELMIDMNSDTNGGLVTLLSQFKISATIRNHQAFFIGWQWLHVWTVSGQIYFYHSNQPDYPPLLTIYLPSALLTSWSLSDTVIGETMTLQTSESADPNITMTPDTLLNGIGISPSCLVRSEDVALTITNIRPIIDPGAPVKLDKDGNFIDEWRAEGSFSASACVDKPIL